MSGWFDYHKIPVILPEGVDLLKTINVEIIETEYEQVQIFDEILAGHEPRYGSIMLNRHDTTWFIEEDGPLFADLKLRSKSIRRFGRNSFYRLDSKSEINYDTSHNIPLLEIQF